MKYDEKLTFWPLTHFGGIYLHVQNPHAIKYIWRTEGFRGLFKENGTNCARIVPNSAFKFVSYEEASKYVTFLHYYCFFVLVIVGAVICRLRLNIESQSRCGSDRT
ncbi:putative mitochondrial carrier domain superfamily [Helianthus annuus]|nr:putative mitochondrial carrier domain superfamily [Helianthus annuus]